MTEAPRSDADILRASEKRAYVGGGYYNPVCELEERARKICGTDLATLDVEERMAFEPYLDDTYFISTLLDALTRRVREGEILFGVYEGDQHRMAPYLYDHERLIEFERQVFQRVLRRRGFYAVEHELANRGLLREFRPLEGHS